MSNGQQQEEAVAVICNHWCMRIAKTQAVHMVETEKVWKSLGNELQDMQNKLISYIRKQYHVLMNATSLSNLLVSTCTVHWLELAE